MFAKNEPHQSMYTPRYSVANTEEGHLTYDSSGYFCHTTDGQVPYESHYPGGIEWGCSDWETQVAWQCSWDGVAYPQCCHKCGTDAQYNGHADAMSGILYCAACWKQAEIEDAYTSDEEEDDVEYRVTLAGHKSDAADDASVVGSTDVDTADDSSDFGTSDVECVRLPLLADRRVIPPWRRAREAEKSIEADVPEWRRVPAWLSLTPTQSSFATQMRLRRQNTASRDNMESPKEIARATRALLNKLTAERFESISAQVCGLPISSPDGLNALVAEVFIKATTDHVFCPLYADLCLRLDTSLNEKQDKIINGCAFRAALQNQYQTTFEDDLCGASEAAALEGLAGDALYEAEVKRKCKRLGTMRFVGELLTREYVAEVTVLSMARQLLAKTGDGGVALESLVTLLQVVGGHFEQSDSLLATALRDIHASLWRRSTDTTLPSRIRFLIRGLLDRGLMKLSTKPRICLKEQTPDRFRGGGTTKVWKPVATKRQARP